MAGKSKRENKRELKPKLRFPEFRDAPGWDGTSLGQVVEFQSGGTPSKSTPTFWNGSIPWVTAKAMKQLFLRDTEDHITKAAIDDGAKQVPAGTVLMLTRGMTLLKDVPICVVCRPMTFNQDVKALHPKKSIDGRFLPWMLLGSKERLLDMVDVAGHGTGKLNTDELKALGIAIPSPAEQTKIVGCLSSLDELIAAESRKLVALQAHKKGLMQQLFPREGETLPRLRFPEFKDAPEWEEKRISKLIDLVSGLHLSPDEYGTTGRTPYFTGPSDFTNEITQCPKWTDRETNFAKNGDTLITVKGSGVGELWYLTLPSVAMGRQLMAVRATNGSSRFIFQFLTTKRSRFEDLASGNLIPGLSRSDILDLAGHFPTFPEQKVIADCLTSVDRLIAYQVVIVDSLRVHKKGLMQQLFPSMEDAHA